MEDPEITQLKARIRNLDTLIIHEKQIDHVSHLMKMSQT